MPKRSLSAVEAFDLRQALHVSVLEALLASRRWEPGDLVFQGGTSLHLAHGSPRFSEDLDFLVKSTLDLHAIGESVQARVGRSPWIPKDARLTVSVPAAAALDTPVSAALLDGATDPAVPVELRPVSAAVPPAAAVV